MIKFKKSKFTFRSYGVFLTKDGKNILITVAVGYTSLYWFFIKENSR